MILFVADVRYYQSGITPVAYLELVRDILASF